MKSSDNDFKPAIPMRLMRGQRRQYCCGNSVAVISFIGWPSDAMIAGIAEPALTRTLIIANAIQFRLNLHLINALINLGIIPNVGQPVMRSVRASH